MTKIQIIHVGTQDIPMRASALVPRLYRVKFGRDMMRDLIRLKDKVKDASEDHSDLDALDLTIFENVSWMLAKHANPDVPDDPDEWLDSIEGVLSIYEALPQILALWSENMVTTSVPKKK